MHKTRLSLGLAVLTASILAVSAVTAFAVGETGGTVDGTLNDKGCAFCHIGDPNTQRRGPHGGYTATTNTCASCHEVHQATGVQLLFKATVTGACLACHDGTGGYGVYGTITARGLGIPGAQHRAVVPTTNVVPGGDATTGGDRVETGFAGEGGFLGCVDCHSPHGANVVTAFNTERERVHSGWTDVYVVSSTNLLKRHPNGSDTTVTAYGSEWCAGCHRGRESGGTPHNHPVDNTYTYDNVPLAPWPGPVDIAVDQASGNVYVTDPGNARVQRFTSAGAFLGSFSTGPSSQPMKEPRGIAVAGGYVYVADSRAGVMSRHDLAGGGATEILRPTGRWANMSPGTYARAVAGLGGSNDGTRLAITDFEGETARVFDASASTLLFSLVPLAGQPYGSPFPSSILGEFFGPADAAVGPTGVTYVVDSMNARVERFDTSGTVIASFGSEGSGNGQFQRPLSLAVDASGRVYVADSGNHRIQRFSATGAYETSFGGPGSGPGQFKLPRGVAIGPTGDIYVVDSGNARIQRLSSAGAFLGQWGSAGSGSGAFAFEPSETGPMAYSYSRPLGQGLAYAGRGYVMQSPRVAAQSGHGPICQQCHEDSRDAGDVYAGSAVPAAFGTVPDGQVDTTWFTWGPGIPGTMGPRGVANPRFQDFPHETVNANMLVESYDDLCLNCHEPSVLP